MSILAIQPVGCHNEGEVLISSSGNCTTISWCILVVPYYKLDPNIVSSKIQELNTTFCHYGNRVSLQSVHQGPVVMVTLATSQTTEESINLSIFTQVGGNWRCLQPIGGVHSQLAAVGTPMSKGWGTACMPLSI